MTRDGLVRDAARRHPLPAATGLTEPIGTPPDDRPREDRERSGLARLVGSRRLLVGEAAPDHT